ncbi:MAG: DUF4248 domain-containing protein [Bacteroides sp.]|nr:DUF4248 domain-containing protein [Bacteroides sp.]
MNNFNTTTHPDTPEVAFEIRSYGKRELAALYSPHLHPLTALKKMNRWIALNPELHRRMYSGREGRNDQFYSRRQVVLLVEYLDAP